MKTFEEIKKHLKENPYSEMAQNQIDAFLMGKGYYGGEDDWEIEFKSEDNEFEDFIDWFEDEEEKESSQKVLFNYGVDLNNNDILDYICAYFYSLDGVSSFYKSRKYKITGEERKLAIERKDFLEKCIKTYETLIESLSTRSAKNFVKAIIDEKKDEIERINMSLNETVD